MDSSIIDICHFATDEHIVPEGCYPASVFQVEGKGPTLQTIISDAHLILTTIPHCLSVDCLKQ